MPSARQASTTTAVLPVLQQQRCKDPLVACASSNRTLAVSANIRLAAAASGASVIRGIWLSPESACQKTVETIDKCQGITEPDNRSVTTVSPVLCTVAYS